MTLLDNGISCSLVDGSSGFEQRKLLGKQTWRTNLTKFRVRIMKYLMYSTVLLMLSGCAGGHVTCETDGFIEAINSHFQGLAVVSDQKDVIEHESNERFAMCSGEFTRSTLDGNFSEQVSYTWKVEKTTDGESYYRWSEGRAY